MSRRKNRKPIRDRIPIMTKKDFDKDIWNECMNDVQLLVDTISYNEKNFPEMLFSNLLYRIRKNLNKLDPIPPKFSDDDLPF